MAVPTLATLPDRDLLGAEWIKFRSVRSSYLTVLVVAGVMLLLAGVFSDSLKNWDHLSAMDRARFDPVRSSLQIAVPLAEAAFGVLGVLAFSSEYGTGLIHATFAATPARRRVLAAKAAIVGGIALVVGQFLVLATFLVGQAALSAKRAGVGAGLGDPHVLRALTGCGLLIGTVAMIGIALGSMLRSSAGAISALFGLVFAADSVGDMLSTWSEEPARWALNNIFTTLVQTHRPPESFQPTVTMAFVECAVYIAVFLALAATLITRRDT
ncbi:hypothetical protein [Embleya sp. AB8]|uniref:hypothetical protein n=1 Tax=Embleya sp. AB8 TaxID=3156304 RepID=UPI003C7873E7